MIVIFVIPVGSIKRNADFVFPFKSGHGLGSVWMGYSSWRGEISRDRIFLTGDPILIKTIDRWLVQCDYAAAAE